MTIDWATIFADTWKVLAVGILLGSGLPFLFALGIDMWDRGEGGQHADGSVSARRPVELTLAYAVFAVIAVAVLLGLIYLMKASISHYLGITVF